jgi:PAS domain S-box-containing protein
MAGKGEDIVPGQVILKKKPEFYRAWRAFIETGEINNHVIRPVIAESWKRSRSYGVDPYTSKRPDKLHTEEIEKRYKKMEKLINISKPFMSSLYSIVENSGFIVRLADDEGYILVTLGDKDIIEGRKGLNIFPGDNCSEQRIGTNAIGTSIVAGTPLQVFAAEHYCRDYHIWTSSACPIRDTRGRIIGVLSMTGEYDKVHPHTLGMVVAAVEAIENQMEIDEKNQQLAMAVKHFHAIMESISEGLVSVDEKGRITEINYTARKMVGIREDEIIGQNIKRLFDTNTRKILNVLKTGKGFSEEEMVLETRQRSIRCITTATPILMEKEKVAGAVITIREIKTVHNLVNRMVGANARFGFDDILGESQKIKEAIRLAKLAAANTTTVLLMGESGTGKEMFAQAIHNFSSRRDGSFVFLNCGAIPRELVASELFGYVEGAFTGAKRGGHPGKFELADGGTIFLDEIGDMPLDAQAHLLRVLETKQITRIGGNKVIPVDVRVIAATHKDLEAEVRAGNFRQDLFFRLNVMPIKIPPLRERKEDIPILIAHFKEKLGEHMGKAVSTIDRKFLRAMMHYSWPGNVRELQNVLQQAINLADGDVLTEEHLPDSIRNSGTPFLNNMLGDEPLSLEEVEKREIVRTLQIFNGNITKTAESLGIGRNTLYRKMKKYGIESVP